MSDARTKDEGVLLTEECTNRACAKAHDNVVDLLRVAVNLHKRNCDCEACYWIGRVAGRQDVKS